MAKDKNPPNECPERDAMQRVSALWARETTRVIDNMLRAAAASEHPNDWLVHWADPFPKKNEDKDGNSFIVTIDYAVAPPDLNAIYCWPASYLRHHACLRDVRAAVRKVDKGDP